MKCLSELMRVIRVVGDIYDRFLMELDHPTEVLLLHHTACKTHSTESEHEIEPETEIKVPTP